MSERVSGFRPAGKVENVAKNPFFEVNAVQMDFIDSETGAVKFSHEKGGRMNWVDMRPGVTIVADIEGESTLLVPVERFDTNIVESRAAGLSDDELSVVHYEFPAGGIDKDADPYDEAAVLAAAAREFSEEAGFLAEELEIVGSRHRGLMSHPGVMTHHNYTVLARGLWANPDGPQPELTEILGKREMFTWDEVEEMALNPNGLWVPEKGHNAIISSAATVASGALVRAHLRRRARATHIDLKHTT